MKHCFYCFSLSSYAQKLYFSSEFPFRVFLTVRSFLKHYFLCLPFLCLLSKECFILNKYSFHVIQSHYTASNVIGCRQRRRFCFVPLFWRCFWVGPVPAGLLCFISVCFGLLQFIQGRSHFFKATFSQNISTFKFTKNELQVRFYCKGELYQKLEQG